ncbi:hypothetical protein [Acinetobacter tianfuensis]|nr:hypothetical protein [Acinetobacter tianfuensis]
MNVLIILVSPIIGVLTELIYFHYLKEIITISFFTNAKDLATALLSYAIAMFGIVAMIITLVYGLSKPGVSNYRKKFGVQFALLWIFCIIYLSLTGLLSILGFAKIDIMYLSILIKIFLVLFISSFIQSIITIFIGIAILINSNKVA